MLYFFNVLMKFFRSLLPEWHTDTVMASTRDDISPERMGLNSRRWIEQNYGVGGGGDVLSDQDTLAKVEYPSSSISVFPGFLSGSDTNFLTGCLVQKFREQKKSLSWSAWTLLCRQMKGIDQLYEFCFSLGKACSVCLSTGIL